MSPVKPVLSHSWDLTPEEAVSLQQELRAGVVEQPIRVDELKYVAGVDVGFREGMARAVVVILAYPSMQLLEHAIAEVPVVFPYIPGLLSFRETPAILAALEKIDTQPDLLVCDGQGIAHPRRFGIACHIGVLLDRPTLGCAKSVLTGRHAAPGDQPGDSADLLAGREVIGSVVRTRKGVKPVIVSIGHKVDLPSAVQATLACTRGYRLPEPTRLADRLASRRGPVAGANGPLLT